MAANLAWLISSACFDCFCWANADVVGIDLGITLLSAENLRTRSVWRWVQRQPNVLPCNGPLFQRTHEERSFKTGGLMPDQPLRDGKDLLPDSKVVAADDLPDLIVCESAFREHLNKAVPVFVHGLGFDAGICPARMTFHFAPAWIGFVMAQPADSNVFHAHQLCEVLH